MLNTYINKLYGYKKQLDWKDWLFIAASSVIVVATVFGNGQWFKTGIALPFLNRLGELPGQSDAKIYLFECYIIFILVIYCTRIRSGIFLLKPQKEFFPLFLTAFLFAYWIVTLIFRFPENLLLAIRNSAFLWYLIVPLILALARIPQVAFNALAALCALASFSYYIISLIFYFLEVNSPIAWSPQIGIYGAILFFFFSSKSSAFLIPAIVGFGLGLSSFTNFQRTSLLGLVLIMIVLAFYRWKKIFIGLSVAVVTMLATHHTLKNLPQTIHRQTNNVYSFTNSPFKKSESTQSGLEVFRWTMWKDAWGLFVSNPVFGIGYEKQVVYRVYKWSGIYVPNDVHWMKNPGQALKESGEVPPISGPHNSYLNAIVRVGALGIFILILHLFGFYRLWQNGNHYPAVIIFGQTLYAFFNVGLEGPARSALLLIFLGFAVCPWLNTPQTKSSQ